MTVVLGLTPDSRWQLPTRELITAVAAAGFTTLGLSSDRVSATTRAELGGAGLHCHEVLALLIGRDEEKNRSRAEALARAASEAGSPWVLTVFGTRITSGTADTLRECAAIVAGGGAGLALEFSPLGPVPSIDAALEGVEVIGPKHAAVMIDSWHFSRGPSTWAQLESVPLDRIAYLQFDDALPAESDQGFAETMNRRVFPGDGEFELERFADTLRGRGWSGVVSVEVLSEELRQLPVPDFARRAHDSAARYWL